MPVLFSQGFVSIASYRFNRALFLLLGPAWKAIHLLLAPVRFLFRPWTGGCDIHYEADIAGGLTILHPALGVVISKYAIIGRNCTLTGGNCIGGKGPRHPLHSGAIRIGDDVELGAHAVVLGPINVGDRAIIAAVAVAVHDVADDQIVAGIPAQPLPTSRDRLSPPMRLTRM